jgi:hypothetical protein
MPSARTTRHARQTTIENATLQIQKETEMASPTFASAGKKTFRVFISYASEDVAIATEVASCFKAALPDFFAEVSLDKEFLEPGSPFQAQIEAKLQQTDVFVILYTGAEKRSHGYTGWEVGYFDRIMRTEPGRRKISLYLNDPPAITASEQGISLAISKDQLQLTFQDFQSGLCVSPEEPLCKELARWQKEVDKYIEADGFQAPRRPEQEPAKCVYNMRLALFNCLKGTVESVVQPQKQITIRVKGSALEQSNEGLPDEAELRVAGAMSKGGCLSIFGLSEEVITWKQFLDRVDVDNSQVILASDGKTAYRVILTRATKSMTTIESTAFTL